MAAGAPAPPTSPPFSQHSLSSRGSACVSPAAKPTAGFRPGTETSSKTFPGLYGSCCCLSSAHHRGVWQPVCGQEARLCLTEPVACLLVTFACRHLAACRAHRCLPPSTAELTHISRPGKSALAVPQALGAGVWLPEEAARGRGERGTG